MIYTVSHRVAMSMHVSPPSVFFLGLSLAFRSHDQFEASHCTMQKKELIFQLPRRASGDKLYFLVLVRQRKV